MFSFIKSKYSKSFIISKYFKLLNKITNFLGDKSYLMHDLNRFKVSGIIRKCLNYISLNWITTYKKGKLDHYLLIGNYDESFE